MVWVNAPAMDICKAQELHREGKARPGPVMERLQRGEPSPHTTPEQLAAYRVRLEVIESDLALADSIFGKRKYGVPLAEMSRVSDWERYVKRFMARFHLDDEQRQRCETILRKCQHEGHEYLR